MRRNELMTNLSLECAAQIGIVKLHRGYVEQPQNCLRAPNPLFAVTNTISVSHFGHNLRVSRRISNAAGYSLEAGFIDCLLRVHGI